MSTPVEVQRPASSFLPIAAMKAARVSGFVLTNPALKRRARHSLLLLLLYIVGFPSASVAEHTRNWRQSTYEEFLKGTSVGVAVRSDGRLELSPRFKLLSDADASYLWSVRVDPKGVLYAAGGSTAKVFRFDANGKPALAFESTDLAAQAIAFD